MWPPALQTVTLAEARDLMAKDEGGTPGLRPGVGLAAARQPECTRTRAAGTSDPFCELVFGAVNFKTEIMLKNLNPQWNAEFQWPPTLHRFVKA